jgi:hypothetical protein
VCRVGAPDGSADGVVAQVKRFLARAGLGGADSGPWTLAAA